MNQPRNRYQAAAVMIGLFVLGLLISYHLRPDPQPPSETVASLTSAPVASPLPVGPVPSARPPRRPPGATADVLTQYESALDLADGFSFMEAFHALLRQAGPADFPALLQKVNQRHDGSLKDAQLTALIERWGLVDPAGAIAVLKAQTGYRSTQQVGRLHAIWAQQDPARALASAKQLADPRQRNVAVEHILSAQANRDPPGALRLLASLPSHHYNARWAHEHIFSKWAQFDPAAASQALDQVLSPQFRQQAIQGLVGTWTQQHPTAALAWVQQLEPGAERTKALQKLLQSWASQDPVAAAVQLDQVPPGQVASFTRQVALQWAESDPTAALAWLEQNATSNVRAEAMSDIARQWVRTDPAAALQLLERIDNEQTRRNALSNLGAEWLRVDREQAWAWIQSLPPDHPGRANLVAQAASVWGQENTRAAAEAALALGETERAQFANALVGPWTQFDPAGAFAWTQQLGLDAQSTTRLQDRIFSNWTQNDRAGADQFAQLLPEDAGKAKFAARLAAAWAAEDPPRALAWLEHVPSGKDRLEALSQVAQQFIRQDAPAAATWINQLPAGPERDTAVRSLVTHLQPQDPAAAFLWAETLPDTPGNSGERFMQASRAVQRLKMSDPARAQQLIQQAAFTAEQKERLWGLLR